MEKHKEIWLREESFLEKVIKESALEKEELYSRIEKLTKGRNSELDSVKCLDSESAKDLREDLSVVNESIFVKEDRYNTFNKFVLSPYFFRVGTDRGAIYISKHFANLKNNIVSFTSPVAQLRYGELNKPIKVVDYNFSILDKDEIEIEDSKLLKLAHEDLDSNFTYRDVDIGLSSPKPPVIDIEVKKENLLIEQSDIPIIEEKAKIKEPHFESKESEKEKVKEPISKSIEGEKLEKKKYVLGEIIEQMREEQDEIMRSPISGTTLISGTAGSGKTNIAFHRIVYLIREFGVKKAESFFSRILNTFNKESNQVFHEENIAVFCFNVPLRKYLGNLSKELGISNINIYSIDAWIWDKLQEYSDFTKRDISYEEKEEDILLKTRKGQIEQIEKFVQSKLIELYREVYYAEERGISEKLGKLLSLKDSLRDLSSLYILRQRATGQRFDYIKTKIEKNDQEKGNEENKKTDYEITYLKPEEREKINKFISKKTFEITKKHFFSDSSTFEKSKFRFYDLLSDYYKCLNDESSSNRIINEHKIYISDGIIFCLIILDLTKGGDYSIRLVNKGKEILKFFPLFDHVVIDEVQDFLPLQTILLNKISKNSMTIVGDTTQGIFSQGIKSWEEIGIPIDYHYELKLSHRSTLENILFANEIVSTKNKSLATTVAKRGPKPVISICSDFDEVRDRLLMKVKEIKEISPKDSIVVLDPDNYKVLEDVLETFEENNIESYIPWKGSWEFGNKVSLTTYRQIKGLEFDHVFILGLNTFETSDKIKNKKNLLYTVITRAQKSTYILCEKELPNILKKVDRDLYNLE
jgi:DNA helicase IV